MSDTHYVLIRRFELQIILILQLYKCTSHLDFLIQYVATAFVL